MLLVHSENLLLVDTTIKYPDLFLVAYLSAWHFIPLTSHSSAK